MVQQYWAATWISSSEPDGFCCVKNSKGSSGVHVYGDFSVTPATMPKDTAYIHSGLKVVKRGSLHPLIEIVDLYGFIWIYMDLYGFMWILWLPQLVDTSFGD